jgi:taurine dioxygenase
MAIQPVDNIVAGRHNPSGDAKSSKIEMRPVAGAIGAEIFGVDLSKPVGDSMFADIYKAFLDYLVVFFPQQPVLTPDMHMAFASRFGDVDMEPFVYPFKTPTVAGYPQILLNVKESGDRSINVGGFWHADVTYRERPHKAAIMYTKETPAVGGDTLFSTQYLAFETLSVSMRQMLGGLKAVHSSEMPYGGEAARFASVALNQAPRPEDRAFSASLYDRSEQNKILTTEHPVVRTHPETFRPCLYVNRGFTDRFVGMTREESYPLLEYLWNHATRTEFTCRYKWSNNDVVVWDNRSALHYALNDYYGHRREMHRISVHEPSRPI